jgi:hypothetical protein
MAEGALGGAAEPLSGRAEPHAGGPAQLHAVPELAALRQVAVAELRGATRDGAELLGAPDAPAALHSAALAAVFDSEPAGRLMVLRSAVSGFAPPAQPLPVRPFAAEAPDHPADLIPLSEPAAPGPEFVPELAALTGAPGEAGFA